MHICRLRLVVAAAACLAGMANAQTVAPPPLPIGSALARPMPGMSEPESKRAMRAHHHKFQHGKDYTRDDSIYGHESAHPEALRPVGTRNSLRVVPGTAAPAGGAGTGPARQQTDKGASSYFLGKDKK